MHASRRKFLAGAAVGGGLLLAWTFVPRHYPAPIPPGPGEFEFDAWLKIARDGVVTVAVPQLEMGQGVTTLLPQIVAMELGADWRQVAVEPAPPSGAYANVPLAAHWAPLWMPFLPGIADEPDDFIAARFAQSTRFCATAAGTSLAAYEMPCREAGAAARAMLAMAAAERWGVAWEECRLENGLVFHGEKSLSFGQLAEEASGFDPPDPPPLRPELLAEQPLPGEDGAAGPYPRIDLPAKVDGSYQFAGDVRLPGMVFAAIRHGPLDRSRLARFRSEAAAGLRGLAGIVEGKRWLAAAADTWWTAEQALERMNPVFSLAQPVDSAAIEQALDDGVRRGEGQRLFTRGEGGDPIDRPDLALRYDVAPAHHGALETASATARLTDGRLELWIATQAPEHARRAAARALGAPLADVVLYPMPAGGSFDRRLEHDHAIEVALIARELGRPVQLVWSRWQEQLVGRPRPPVAALLTAKLGQGGEIRALKTRLAMPSSAREFGHRLFDNYTSWAAIRDSAGEPDPLAAEGAMPIYAIPHVAVDHVPVRIGLPTGRMRGNAHGYTAFFTECYVDEVAERTNREPLSFRIEMLRDDLRMVACLQRVARLADWGGGIAGSGEGLACHRIGPAETGGRIACIAEAGPGEGGVQVRRMSAVVDIGRIVNLDIARQQVEGGLIFGLGLALGSAASYADGLPTTGRLSAFNLPFLADSPEMMVDFVASEAEPADPGELGVAVAAPAIANAFHAATGRRLRRLPLLSEEL